MAEEEQDTAIWRVSLLSKSLEEAKKNFAEATEVVAQVGLLQAKVTELEKTVNGISAEKDEVMREMWQLWLVRKLL